MIESNESMSTESREAAAAEDASAGSQEASSTSAAELQDALAAKTSELERLQDRLLRLQAEFENSKKRMAREKADFLKFANEELVLKFLPVLDNLDRAIGSVPADGPCAALRGGVEMTARLFRLTLERVGVTPVQALGQPFDPSVHQAVAQVESPGGEENVVVEEVQKGYLLEGRVLRPAVVKVSRPAPPTDGGPEGSPA